MSLWLRSEDFREGDHLSEVHVLSEDFGFGCKGRNLSPQLSWGDAPDGTKSFAITCFDPDAPTDCGFWHWLVVNVPQDATAVPRGAGDAAGTGLPAGALQIRTDFGRPGYGGPCPPAGGKSHRYVFSVYALSVPELPVSAETSAAIVSFHLNALALAKATLVGCFAR